MSLNETIDSLATGDYTVTRTLKGVYVSGVYTPGAQSTLSIRAVMEPATGLQRVVGGFEMISGHQGRTTNDVRVLYTRTQLFAQHPTYDPDIVEINGRQYTVFRCEPWDLAKDAANNEIHYRALCTLDTNGAA